MRRLGMAVFREAVGNDHSSESRSLEQVQEPRDRQVCITDQAAEQTAVELSMSRNGKAPPRRVSQDHVASPHTDPPVADTLHRFHECVAGEDRQRGHYTETSTCSTVSSAGMGSPRNFKLAR